VLPDSFHHFEGMQCLRNIRSESHIDMTLPPARPEFPCESISSHEEDEIKLFLITGHG